MSNSEAIPFKSNPKEGGSDDLFVKLKDGEFIEGVFRGAPFEYQIIWDDKNNKSIFYTGKEEGVPRFRFRLNFVIWDAQEKAFKAKIFEQGPRFYNQLKDLNTDWPLHSSWVKITRKGEKLNTEYLVVPKKTIPEEQLKVIRNVDLNKFSAKDFEPKQDSEPKEIAKGPLASEPQFTEDDIPF